MKYEKVMKTLVDLTDGGDMRDVLLQVQHMDRDVCYITTYRPYCDESLWWAAVYNKDRASLTELLRRYESLVKKELRFYTHRDDYDEMCNELWSQILGSLSSYDPKVAPFAAWIKNVVKYRCLDLQRKEGRQQARFVAIGNPSDELDKEGEGLNISHLFIQYENAATGAEKNLLKAEVKWALDSLKPREQEVIVAHYFNGESLQSIAKKWGCSRPNVSKCLARAKTKLKEALEGWYYPT